MTSFVRILFDITARTKSQKNFANWNDKYHTSFLLSHELEVTCEQTSYLATQFIYSPTIQRCHNWCLNMRLPLNFNILNSFYLFICLIYWSILYNYLIHLFIFIYLLIFIHSFIVFRRAPCAVRRPPSPVRRPPFAVCFHHILRTPPAKLCYSFVSICSSELVQCRSCVYGDFTIPIKPITSIV